ncbi:hypothetical protein CO038_00115 [Candidatus Pacearchaeota archaeon CG_4_9_14_0_2_um_filter_39_13]|nr:YIP1 family protein [Candidatus Pacearchaeota archaeon]OIO43576.1 MAG: hypothetical protein AUJ64_02180 [Candidatus Pacearchaeota archaeon CG1_02_39_14]PJC45141.1 MAG: hypothetical protein CO038_00115 [Candidatus Pacearchaeota archaeon CG_4_9_14_0_2_um_filter_39_13]
MVNSDIVRYFREGIERGFSVQVLKKNLKDNGFREDEINDAINSLPASHKNKAESLEKIDNHIEQHRNQGRFMQNDEMHEEERFRHPNMQVKMPVERKENTDGQKPGIFKKIGKAFSHPGELFSATQSDGIGPALKYWFVISLLPLIASLIGAIVLSAYVSSYFTQFGLAFLAGASVFLITAALTGIIFAFLYIIIPILMLITAGFLHLFVKLFKGTGSYANTFSAGIYAATPSIILGFIPGVNFITWIWTFVLMILGLSIMHKMSKVRAFFAIIFAWIVLGGLISLIVYLGLLFY